MRERATRADFAGNPRAKRTKLTTVNGRSELMPESPADTAAVLRERRSNKAHARLIAKMRSGIAKAETGLRRR